MQGKNSTFKPLFPTFEFGSASSNTAMDQQAFWNSMPHISAENQNLPAETLSANSPGVCSGNVSDQDIANTNICDSRVNNSNLPLQNNENHDRFNLEIGCTSPMIPSVNVDIDLNRNHLDNGQSILELSNFDIHQNSGYTVAHVAMSSEVLESEIIRDASNRVLPRPQRISSSSSSCAPGSSSRIIQFFPENGGSTQTIPDGRSFSLKRKNVELAPGPSSTGGSSSSADNYLQYHEDISMQFNNNDQSMTSGDDSFGSIAEIEETFQRNTRIRISHAHPSETLLPYMWPQGNNIRYPDHSSAHLSVSPPIPSDPLVVSSRVANNGCPNIQFHAPNRGLSSSAHPFTFNGAPNSRLGSPGSLTISGGRSVIGETSSRMSLRSDATRHLVIAPQPNPRPVAPEMVNWGLPNGTSPVSRNTLPTSQSGSNIGISQPSSTNWASSQHRRHMLEFLQIPLSSGSEPRGYSVNLPRSDHVSTSQENGNNETGTVARVHQRPSMRSSHGILGNHVPSSLTAMRERRRMRTELRNMFDQIRRSGILPQDLILIDQSMFFRGADFLDRHRDLRLDVDNMSYEELLALEEQIGNVSTGLTDENIKKCLKISEYVTTATEPSKEVEPCCICQEEYVEGQEMGRLECGHDFHTTCIKQWLHIKNQCPICKNAALSS